MSKPGSKHFAIMHDNARKSSCLTEGEALRDEKENTLCTAAGVHITSEKHVPVMKTTLYPTFI